MANNLHLKSPSRINFYLDAITIETLIKEARNRGLHSVSAYLRLHARELRDRNVATKNVANQEKQGD